MAPQSLSDTLLIYKSYLDEKHSASAAQKTFHLLLRGLIYYSFRGWGGPIPRLQQPNTAELDAAWQFMQTVTLLQLKDAVATQTVAFSQLGVTGYCKQTYGFPLRQFLAWVEQQIWWPYSTEPKPPTNRAPKYNHGHGAVGSESVTGRTSLPPYSLLERQTPPGLRTEFEQFYHFFTAAHQPKRQGGPIKPEVVKKYITYIRRFLGWFLQYVKPVYDENQVIVALSYDKQLPATSLEQLTFNLLVPKVYLDTASEVEAEMQAQQVAEYVDFWLCEFLNFLEVDRKNKSWRSLYTAVTAVHALVRFQYCSEAEDAEYRNIPVMQVMRNHLRDIASKEESQKRVSDIDMQWLELPEVWEKIVSRLREECAYRSSDGHLRSISAIAHSFQLFIIWGCLTFRPPRRQQEFRELKIGLSCPIRQPEGLKSGQLVHPLPVDRNQDKYHGYLYRAADGIWYMDMTPESYKTGAIYGHQNLEIPNPSFSDGKSFYDYLEAFLYGYYRDSQGNWTSGGDLSETPDQTGRWYSLRMTFEPTHNHVFGQPKGGKPFDHSEFCKIMRTSANRLTGQRLPPHLLRDIVATWFLDQEYTAEKIKSLAYAMGHSEKMLREIYDRRCSGQKHRPIEETMSSLIQQSMI